MEWAEKVQRQLESCGYWDAEKRGSQVLKAGIITEAFPEAMMYEKGTQEYGFRQSW